MHRCHSGCGHLHNLVSHLGQVVKVDIDARGGQDHANVVGESWHEKLTQ